MKKEEFKNSFNDILKGHKWEVTNPTKIVLLVTGMAEHSARYDHFAKALNKEKISVFCLDHYAQGANGELGNPPVDYFFKMIETIKEYALYLKSIYQVEIILIAHSMGSFISQGVIEKYSKEFSKVVLIGTNGKNPLVKVGKVLSSIIVNDKNYNKKAKFLKSLSIGAYEKTIKGRKSNNEWISYNMENVKTYDADPLSGFDCTNGFYREFLKGLASIQKKKNIAKISKEVPILIIGGDSDAVSNNGKGLKNLFKLYAKADLNVTLNIFTNMRHEILNEENKEKPYKAIIDFVK